MALHPNYWSTALILNFEDASSTTFTDISPTPKTPSSVNGTAANSATQFKTGTKSLFLDGNSDWLEYASHADFDFGSGAFTVSMWWYPSNVTTNQQLAGLNVAAASTDADVAWAIRPGTTGLVNCYIYIGGAPKLITSTTPLAINTWHHIEYSRDASNVCRIRINGVSDATPITYAGTIQTPASRVLRVGRYSTASAQYANGYIDGLVITKGYAVNSADFTPSSELYVASPPGTIEADLTAPMGTLSAEFSGYADLSGPMGTLSMAGGAQAELTGPMGTLYATMHDLTGEREFNGTSPMGTLSMQGGAVADLTAPMGTLVSSMTVPVSITAELVGPMGTLVASMTADVLMRADLRLSSAGTLDAYFGAQVELTAPMGTMDAAVTVGALMSFTATAPIGQLEAIATAGILMRADLTSPMLRAAPGMDFDVVAPMGTLSAILTATVTITYEAYVMNLKPGNEAGIHEVTRWTVVPFDGIVRYGDDYYGWGPGGRHLIGGALDAGQPIAWAWKTAITDFGTSQRKFLRELVLSGRIGPTAVASVSVGEKADITYSYSTPRGQLAQNYRVKTGKGLKDAYYSVGLSGTDVGDVDSVAFGTADGTRRL